MAYYRNYETKDDIILNYLDSLFLQYCNEVMLSENGIDALYINFFSYFRKSGEFINLLIESKLSYLILEKFDEYVTYIKDTVFSAFIYEPVNVYELHYAAGGLYKTMIEWTRNGCTESDEYMAKTVKTLSNYKSSENVL